MDCRNHYGFRLLAEEMQERPESAQIADRSLARRLANASARKPAILTRLCRGPSGAIPAFFAAILVGLLPGTQMAFAQDRSNGEMIANTQCSRCHVIIGTSPRESRSDAIPSFSEVADMPSTNQTSLREFLSMSHPWMPNYRLTRQEIADVADYILSLKR